MKRRDFLGLLGAAATWPLAASGQGTKAPRVGKLYASFPQFVEPFRQGLADQGFGDANSVAFETRASDGNYERLPNLAVELIQSRVDVLAAFGTAAARAAQAATQKLAPTLPVVFSMAGDPVVEGLADSLNRPGHNVTGVTSISAVLTPKRLELMREFLRDGAAVVILMNPDSPHAEEDRKAIEIASTNMGQKIEIIAASSLRQIDEAFASVKARRPGVLLIATDNFFYAQMSRMAELSKGIAVPVIGPLREFALHGGLLSYGASIADVNRQAGALTGKILKGARPSESPILQPTKFELVVNLSTARALGLELPTKLLSLADEVIE